jgi:hypothetical protein
MCIEQLLKELHTLFNDAGSESMCPVSFCITSLGLRTLSGVFKLVSAVFGTGGSPSRAASASRSHSKGKRVTIAGPAQMQHQSTWEISLSEAARTAPSAEGNASPGIDN